MNSKNLKMKGKSKKSDIKMDMDIYTEVGERFDSIKKDIFKNINSCNDFYEKTKIDLINTNNLLNQLMRISFEYDMKDEDLALMLEQINILTDKIWAIEKEVEIFEALKSTFVERIENKIKEEMFYESEVVNQQV
jgi:hypothetical protein